MNDETKEERPLDANAFDEPSIFVGMPESQISAAINQDAYILIDLGQRADIARLRAEQAAEVQASNAIELAERAVAAAKAHKAALTRHIQLLNQTPESWPKPRKPQTMTKAEHVAFCQKMLDAWKARDPENAPATVEEFMIDCHGNWPSD